MTNTAGALWRQRWIALAVLLVMAGAIFATLSLAPRAYTSTATVSATPQSDSTAPESDLTSLRATLGELARSREVLGDVAPRLSQPRSVTQLREEVTGTFVEGTVLVDISVEDRSPQMAAEIANTIADVLPLHDPSGGSFAFTTSDQARPATQPSKPDLPLVIGVGVLLGLILAVVAAVARDRVRRRITNADSLEQSLSAPVLATMPPPRDETSLPALYEGTDAAAVFRELRHALEAAASTDPVSKIVVTGVRPDDANVWLGANLAIALARAGSRTLLIDGRLGDRHGRPVADEPDTPGLYDVLQGVTLERAISPGPVDLLSVLPSGNAGGAPIERIMESRFGELTIEATELFDVVVVLAPALSLGSDAVVMAVDGAVLLGVRSGSVSTSELTEHTLNMRSMGLSLIGSVLFTRRRRR